MTTKQTTRKGSACQECGHWCRDEGEFHPFMFCVLVKAGRDPWAEFRWAAGRFGLKLPAKPPLIRDLPHYGIGPRRS